MSGIVGQNLGRASGLVKSGGVGADAVSGANIADDAIDSEHYTDGSIDNAHIADDAIDSEHYADGSIDNQHLADDAVGLAEMASGTDGNIISYDASGNPVAIATGNDGQVLTSTGAGSPPAFETAGGGWTLIKSITASDSTDVQFINGASSVVLDATYHIYKLFGVNVIPATDTAVPQLHMTTNAGSAWTAVTGSFIAGGGTSGGTTGTPTPEYFATGGFYEPDYGIGSGSGEVACFEATIYLPSATNANVLTHISSVSQTSNNNRYVGMGMHMANGVEDIDGIKIVLSSGNISAGIFKLYGIKA